METLKPQSNGPLCSDTVITYWPLMDGLLRLSQQGGAWVGPQPAQTPSRCTKCNRPPINGQCTNNHISNGPLLCGFNVSIKGLIYSV